MHWLDPEHLPETMGRLTDVLYNQQGDADGLLLDGGRQVHMPPHMGRRVVRHVRAGEQIRVRGVKPRAADLLVALRIVSETGKVFEDEEPPGAPHGSSPSRKPTHVQGIVQVTIFAPRGECAGALLEGGEIVRMHPKGNEGLAEYLQPGCAIDIWGDGFVKSGRRVIDLDEVAWSTR